MSKRNVSYGARKAARKCFKEKVLKATAGKADYATITDLFQTNPAMRTELHQLVKAQESVLVGFQQKVCEWSDNPFDPTYPICGERATCFFLRRNRS